MQMFGQVIIGPPGSGKSTYCCAMRELLTAVGRSVIVVNLDPANDHLPYECEINIEDVVRAQDVMESTGIGPNAAMLYCLEFLETNIDWLMESLSKYDKKTYVLFDCPGQVELYTHHTAVRNILSHLQKADYRLTNVQLIDSIYCSDPAKFVSALLTSLSSMIHLEMPHVNVLSKADLIERYPLPFNMQYFTEVLDLKYLCDSMVDDPFTRKYHKLTEALCNVIEGYSLVSFHLLNVSEKESMLALLKEVDKANGYCFGDADHRTMFSMMSCAMTDVKTEYVSHVAEKLTDVEKR